MLTVLVCLQSRVGDPCQYSHSFLTLRRGFFRSLSISVSEIMPSGSKTWPGRLKYRSNDLISISSSTSRFVVFGSGLKTNSILSRDHKSSTHRIDDWDSPTAIAATVCESLHAFVPNNSVFANLRTEPTHLDPTVILPDYLSKSFQHLLELHCGKKVRVSKHGGRNNGHSPLSMALRLYCGYCL